ncbi:uncharacterized protein LOC121271058 [Carcharodon carcharias]|uniref:uncharacterized protein LOC121271058 n=1 Tax=Carcharodon carcharias TaxID=13397 RepID=UPI001B7EBDED|nr:uncharacterized protein LOC121271058 [Carcharodon carcharias]
MDASRILQIDVCHALPREPEPTQALLPYRVQEAHPLPIYTVLGVLLEFFLYPLCPVEQTEVDRVLLGSGIKGCGSNVEKLRCHDPTKLQNRILELNGLLPDLPSFSSTKGKIVGKQQEGQAPEKSSSAALIGGTEMNPCCQCIKTTSTFIHPRHIDNFEIIPSGPHCGNVEIIATLKNMGRVCLWHEDFWVKKIIDKMMKERGISGSWSLVI